MLRIREPVVAYALDEALALRLLFDDVRAQAAAKAQSTGPGLPPGYRYETLEDVIEREGMPPPQRIH
jgi:hypothetical protein